MTYAALSKGRFNEVVKWLTRRTTQGDGLICFDEVHTAKSGLKKPTETGRMVGELQLQCPGCPVLYASATGAT